MSGYDLIGDVHGCRDELVRLLTRLGYAVQPDAEVVAPAGRTAIFLGDLVNRGPDTPGVLRLVMSMVKTGSALAVVGNHDVNLVQGLRGQPVEKPAVIAETLRQMAAEPGSFHHEAIGFIQALPKRLRLDAGNLIVAHAGLPEQYHAVESAEADDFAVFGKDVPDESGKPVRYRFGPDYHGNATVVFGHYSDFRAEWVNNAICIDTGCVYGGSLTALRYPERELVSVPASMTYAKSAREPQFRAAAAALGTA
jgi:protein phosphatase